MGIILTLILLSLLPLTALKRVRPVLYLTSDDQGVNS